MSYRATKKTRQRLEHYRTPDPTGGAYNAPPDLLVGWEGQAPSPDPTASTLDSGQTSSISSTSQCLWISAVHVKYSYLQINEICENSSIDAWSTLHTTTTLVL